MDDEVPSELFTTSRYILDSIRVGIIPLLPDDGDNELIKIPNSTAKEHNIREIAEFTVHYSNIRSNNNDIVKSVAVEDVKLPSMIINSIRKPLATIDSPSNYLNCHCDDAYNTVFNMLFNNSSSNNENLINDCSVLVLVDDPVVAVLLT